MNHTTASVGMCDYTIENARELASYVKILFSVSTLDQAIRDAMDEQVEHGEEGRVQVFIPSGSSFTSTGFDDLLRNPKSHPLEKGEESSGPAIYGKRNDAYLGTTKSGRYHPGFLVFDSGTALIVDFIGRDGKSKLNPMLRQDYNSMLERELEYSVAWQERALSD